jgi:hypothetical protein
MVASLRKMRARNLKIKETLIGWVDSRLFLAMGMKYCVLQENL